MSIPHHLRGVKGDECQCGRRASIRHCPACGASRIYGYVNEQWFERPNGKVERVRLFRCLSCAHKFTDSDREFCEAPPVSAALALQRIKAIHDASQTGEYLRPQDEAIAKALSTLLSPAAQTDHIKAHKLLVYNLQTEYVDRKAAGEQMSESMDEFVDRRLQELGAPKRNGKIQEQIKTEQAQTPTLYEVPDPREDDREVIPVEERSIRLEWSRAKLAGRRVPSIDEYVARRLAGETAEAILNE